MKQLIIPAVIIVALIAFFVIIDRKEFTRHDDVQTVQSESSTTNRKPTASVPETTPAIDMKTAAETKPAETKPVIETKPVAETKPGTEAKLETEAQPKTEAKPAETKPVAETKIVETKPVAEAKSVTETKPEAKTKTDIPMAIPVLTREKAEEANKDALIYAEKHKIKTLFTRSGMDLINEDNMNKTVSVNIPQKYEDIFRRNGVSKTMDELSTKKIPHEWVIDFNSLESDCDFKPTKKGYRIYSPKGYFKLLAPQKNASNTITGISIEITCNTEDTHVKIGIEEYGLSHPGKILFQELDGLHDRECINYEISPLNHFDVFRPVVEVQGDATIHSLRIFRKPIKDITYLDGTITERSTLPDPKDSDYPNCRFTAHFIGNTIKAGERVPQEMELIIEGFEEYKIMDTDKIQDGNKVECIVIPFEKLAEEDQGTQQSDDLNLYSLAAYYCLAIHKTNELKPILSIPFLNEKDEYVSIFERHINQPIPQHLLDLQNKAIASDLQKTNQLLKDYNAEKINSINLQFEKAWLKEIGKDSSGFNRVKNTVWRNVNNSFWCLPEKYTFLSEPDTLTQEVLDCFAALKKACESNGVQLIISLVPDFYVISSRVINTSFRNIPDLQTAMFVKQLSEIGVETIYSSDTIIHNYNRYQFAFFYPTNPHPSDTTQDIISDILADRIKRFGIKKNLLSTLFAIKESPHAYQEAIDYRFPFQCDIGLNQAGKSYKCREVFYNNQKVSKDKDSPILVIGNSYIGTPVVYPPESLPTLLSYKLCSTIDWYRISGYGPFIDVLIQIMSRPSFFLEKKKVVIFHFGTETLKRVNKLGTMANIEQMDIDKILLNNKKLIASYTIPSNTPVSELQENGSWNSLPGKILFRLKDNNELNYSVPIINDFSSSILCVIPAVSYPKTTWDGAQGEEAYLIVNGKKKRIPSFNLTAHYYNLPFELPANTKELNISIEGASDALIAIKDIQIWQ